MRALSASVLLLGLSLVTNACSPRSAERPDVLLITVDTLRADHLSSYGFELKTTPNIDALAERGVVFERAVAAASTTAPAHASIMTSRYTRGHSIGFLNDGSRLEGAVTLAEVFREHGYRTAGFVGNIVLQRRNGFDRGFDTYDDELATPEPNRPQIRERTASETTERALAWLRNGADAPVFVWVHYQDPHGPYAPPPEFVGRFRVPPREGEQELPVARSDQPWDAIPAYQAIPGLSLPSDYRGRYADEIFYTDRSIGRLVAEFGRLGRQSVVLLTSDHGESLGEDGRFFMHGFATTPQLAHVPLILVAPGLPAAHRNDELVHHVDVMPTLLDLAGLEVPDGAAGTSLARLVRGALVAPARIAYCDIGSEASAYRGRQLLRALGVMGAWGPEARSGEPVWQAYDWHRDGSWSRAVGGADLPRDDVRRYVDSAVPIARTELSPERIAELRALGYVVDH